MSAFVIAGGCLAIAWAVFYALKAIARARADHAAEISAARRELDAIRGLKVQSWQDTVRMLALARAIDDAKTPQEQKRALAAFQQHLGGHAQGGTKP